MIKAWIKSGTERGLHRSVLLLRSLALNGINGNASANVIVEGDIPESSSTTLFDRIARWGTSLLSNNGNSGRQTKETRTENASRNKSNTQVQSQDDSQFGGVGIANRLNYIAQETPAKTSAQPSTNQFSIGMHSRMLLMSSAFQTSDAQSSNKNSIEDEAVDEKRGVEPIGPLPHIESDILPDISTFRLLINGESYSGSISPRLFLSFSHLKHFVSTPLHSNGTSGLDHFSKASGRLVIFARRVLF